MKARGLSLLEIMMVIAVSAIVFIIAVNYYTNVHLSNKVNQTIMQVRNLYQGGATYFRGEKYQAPAFNTTDITQALVQGSYVTPNDIASPWGNNQNNKVQLSLSTTTNKLIIVIPALPTQACNVITNRLKSPFPNAGFSSCSQAATNGLTITLTLTVTE